MTSIPLKMERDDDTYYLIFGPDEGRTKGEAEKYCSEIEESLNIEGLIIEEINLKYQVYGTVQVIDRIVENEREKLGIKISD